MKKINESTLIPIGLAISTIGGGAVWLTNLHYATAANSVAIEKVQKRLDTIDEIKTDIAVIKTKLEAIERQTKREN